MALDEQEAIDRLVISWAKMFPDFPIRLRTSIEYNAPSLALSPIQGALVSARYITGGYQGEYPFSVTYRVNPGNSDDLRLKAIEMLNRFAAWAAKNPPVFGDGVNVLKLTQTSRPVIIAPYENGDEDIQEIFNLTFERVK